ncbi:hypothetical protein D3C72_1984560 [compost metagenome]
MPIGSAALVHVAQSGPPFWCVGERWIFLDADGRPTGLAQLVLQIQHDLEGVVEQKRLDLWGHADTVDQVFVVNNREESGLWSHEAVLGIYEAQAGIGLRDTK